MLEIAIGIVLGSVIIWIGIKEASENICEELWKFRNNIGGK